MYVKGRRNHGTTDLISGPSEAVLVIVRPISRLSLASELLPRAFVFRKKCLTNVSFFYVTTRYSWLQTIALDLQHLPNRRIIASRFSVIVMRKISQISMCEDSLCGAHPKKSNTIEGDSHRGTLSFYMSRQYFAVSCLTAQEDNRRGVGNTCDAVVSTWRNITIFFEGGNNETRQDWQDWWLVCLLRNTLIFVWRKTICIVMYCILLPQLRCNIMHVYYYFIMYIIHCFPYLLPPVQRVFKAGWHSGQVTSLSQDQLEWLARTHCQCRVNNSPNVYVFVLSEEAWRTYSDREKSRGPGSKQNRAQNTVPHSDLWFCFTIRPSISLLHFFSTFFFLNIATEKNVSVPLHPVGPDLHREHKKLRTVYVCPQGVCVRVCECVLILA